MKKFLSRKRNLMLLGLLLLVLAGTLFFFWKDELLLSEDARFEKFTEKLFQEDISGNTLNLHYTLAYPAEYGIEDYQISLGSMSPDLLAAQAEAIEARKKQLERFSPEKLSTKNQMIYDILRLEFATELSAKASYLLQEPLGPNLGIQAQLPVLLAEYQFRTLSDIKDYFSLLSAAPEYFESILAFEQEKSAQGFFMSDTSVDRIAEQCRSFSETQEENYLYTTFQERIDALLNAQKITKTQWNSYIEMNDKLIREYLFPAYEALASGLEQLKGSGKNENGLSHLSGGKAYYEYLVKSSTGDYRSIEEIEENLYQQLMTDYEEMLKLQEKDPDLISKALALPSDASCSPEQMLDYLQHIMSDDFPDLEIQEYEVKYVPEAMEEFSSPAFYLTPPIDTLKPNTIYINQSSQVSQAELFTTLAHEGFPGHLYQTQYFGSQKQAPIRDLLTCSGYVEGWATYVEAISYGYAADFLNIEPDVMRFLCLNRSVSLCLYSLLDIGIHDKGWTLETVTDTLSSFGVAQEEVCREIFQYIVENPANYLKYYLGYLNFCNLQKAVQEMEGDSFSLKEFHQNLLELGPAQFPVVKKYLLMRY